MAREKFKAIVTSMSGNVVEWYDFALYGYFATLISKLFFPARTEFLSLIITFSVFASGFLVRPIGGIVFGYVGDRFGRRISLIASISLMIFPTALIGCIPSYASIGLYSPILITLMRLLQGMAVSGELTSSATFLIESAPENRAGFYNSLIMSSTYLGLLIGAVVCLFVSFIFDQQQIESYAWRIPFLLSFFMGSAVLLLRIQCKESPVFTKMEEDRLILSSPIRHAIKNYSVLLILICLLSSSLAVAIYLMIGYFPSYFIIKNHMNFNQSMITNLLGLLVLTVCVPIMGKLSDKYGHMKMLGVGAAGYLLFSCEIFKMASNGNMCLAICSMIMTALLLSPIAASLIYISSNVFPPNIRSSSVSIGYNFSMSIFGGTTPLISIYLCDFFDSDLAPSALLMLTSLLTLFALYFLNNYKKIIQTRGDSCFQTPMNSKE